METGRWWLSEGRGVVWEWLLTGRGSWGDELEPGRGAGSAASQLYHVPPHGAPDTVAAAGFVAEFATRRTENERGSCRPGERRGMFLTVSSRWPRACAFSPCRGERGRGLW